jgi:DNA processing protein
MGEFPPDHERPASEVDDLSDVELTVFDALPRRGSRTLEEIAVVAGLPVADVIGPLTMLDVRGLVIQEDGCWKLARR